VATNYPGAIDSLTNPSAGDALTSPSHSAQHANANDAIKAIETELGTDPSGASATVKARFEAIEANDWVTSARIAADAVGSSELADNAVDTNAIQDGAVTSAKVADGAITAAKMQRQVGNLLTDNQASGGDALGNTTGFGTWNAEPSYSGGRIVGTKNVGPGTGWGVAINPKAAVTAGETYTVYAEVERLTAAGTAATLWWSDVSNNSLGGVSITPYSTASGVVTGKVTVTAPANAVWAELTVYGSDADANGSTIAVHKVGVWRGKGGQWSLPGTPVLGLEDGLAKVGNLLTDNQASGGDALGNTTGFATWNAEPSYSGGRIVGTKNVGPGTGWGVAINPKAAVTPGETYTIYAQSERLTGAGISTTLWWSDASNNSLGGVSVISWTTATGVQTGQIVATAPANAAWAEVFTYGADADANGSTVAVHKVGLWRGAGGLWQLPGVPITGQSHIATNGASHLSGTGSPEGVVTAAPGSTWLQTDATTDVKGWIRWVKATGTGNTGWQVGPEADTGWRNVSSLLFSGLVVSTSEGHCLIRRRGSQVNVRAKVDSSGAAVAGLFSVPAGFLPTQDKRRLWPMHLDSSEGAVLPPLTTANQWYMSVGNSTLASQEYFPNPATVVADVSWDTADAWPSSLPGSAA